MTNLDRIRGMNAEELAHFLASDKAAHLPCLCCDYSRNKETGIGCNCPDTFICVKEYAFALILQWLESEEKSAPDEMKKALDAYNTIREYCQNQKCSNCLFSDKSGMCDLYCREGVPESWHELNQD